MPPARPLGTRRRPGTTTAAALGSTSRLASAKPVSPGPPSKPTCWRSPASPSRWVSGLLCSSWVKLEEQSVPCPQAGAFWGPEVTWPLFPQAGAERNYHIFYQLCASAALPELQGLGLREYRGPVAWRGQCWCSCCSPKQGQDWAASWVLCVLCTTGWGDLGPGGAVLVSPPAHFACRWGRDLPLHPPGAVPCWHR